MSWQQRYVERCYRSRPGWRDGTQEFHDLCRRFITDRSRVLEIGPGTGGQTSVFLASVSPSLTGVDVDDDVRKNPHLSQACVYDGQRLPLDEASFDAAVSDYVLEHVADPPMLCREVRRVLVPGGVFLFRTPNRLHYVSLLSRVLPGSLSVWARNLEPEHRVHPKFFRCNSERKCRRVLGDAGFEVLELRLIEKEPSYGMKSRLLFFPMLAYERVVNSSDLFRGLRANILCAARTCSTR